MKTLSLTFYEDAGHGWLRVLRTKLVDLGIADKISRCSYMYGKWAYLEEDCDAPLFLDACENAGITVNWTRKYSEYAAIRGYSSYQNIPVIAVGDTVKISGVEYVVVEEKGRWYRVSYMGTIYKISKADVEGIIKV